MANPTATPPTVLLRYTDPNNITWELAQGEILDNTTGAIVVNTDHNLWVDRCASTTPYAPTIPREKRWRFRAGYDATTWAQLYGIVVPIPPDPNVPVEVPWNGVPAAMVRNFRTLGPDLARVVPAGGYGPNPPSDPANLLAVDQMPPVLVVVMTNFNRAPFHNRRARLGNVYQRATREAMNPTQPPPLLVTAAQLAMNTVLPPLPQCTSISFPVIGYANGTYPAEYAADDAVRNVYNFILAQIFTFGPASVTLNHIAFVVPPRGPGINRSNEVLRAYKAAWNRYINPLTLGTPPGPGVIPAWNRTGRIGPQRILPPRPFTANAIPAPGDARTFNLRNRVIRVRGLPG